MDDVDAAAKPPDATFEVLDHFYVTGRGGLVIGLKLAGHLRPGMTVRSPATGTLFTVSAIESLTLLDKTIAMRNGRRLDVRSLLFPHLSKAELIAAFPVGSVVLLFKE